MLHLVLIFLCYSVTFFKNMFIYPEYISNNDVCSPSLSSGNVGIVHTFLHDSLLKQKGIHLFIYIVKKYTY